MAILNCTLLNFSGKDFLSIFEDYPDEFEYTANGVFRRTTPSLCPECVYLTNNTIEWVEHRNTA